MRLAAVSATILVLAVVAGAVTIVVGRDEGQAEIAPSPFWDEGAVHPFSGLADYITIPDATPDELYAEADAVIVGRVDGVYNEAHQTIEPVDGPGWEKYGATITDYFASTPSRTEFAVTPTHWIKGDGTEPVLVSDLGGRDAEGRYVGITEHDLLLEPGRTYLLFLRGPSDHPQNPHPDAYTRMEVSRGTFDLTTGHVLVFDTSITEDLEQYEGLSLDEFLTQAVGITP